MPDSVLAMVGEACPGWPAESLLFTHDGKPGTRALREDHVHGSLSEARRRTSVGPHLTIHQLRHGFATHLHERGVGVVELQRLLGHRSVEVTMGYIGLRDERRADIARVGDLLAALPSPAVEQHRISFAG